MVDCYTVYIVCKFVELLEKIDRRTNKKIEDNFKCVKFGDVAIVKMELFKLFCVEFFVIFLFFGRFVVRDMK